MHDELTLTVGKQCLLEGFPLQFEKQLKERLTIDNPKYIAARKYGRWIGKKLQPKLKYYDPVPNGLLFPRGFANQAVLMCRELLGVDPKICDNRRLLPEIDVTFSGILREYQQEAVAKVGRHSFGVLEAGTGSGKTVMALALIAQRKQPTLVIVHTKELLYQWRDRIAEFLGLEAGLVGDGQFEIRDVTVAIVNTARKRVGEFAEKFGHLIVDECHRVPAALFTDVVSAFDCHYMLGLSATAFRSDDQTTRLIYYFMGDPVHKVNQEMLAATGAIVKPRVYVKTTDFVYNYTGDYQALMTALTQHQGRNMQILEDIKGAADDADTVSLVVSDRVNHCTVFYESLVRQGYSAALLTGQTSAEARAKIVAQVQNNEVQILVATLQLIGEGFDCPGLSNLFLTTPITFEGRLLQVIGRIMRPAPGKEARVYDYLDHNVSALRKSANIRHAALRRVLEPTIFQVE